MDSEVPHAEVDGFRVEDLNQGVLADEQRFLRDEFEPVASGQEGGVGFDDVSLMLAGVEQRDVEAVDHACVGADINADDDVVILRESLLAGLGGGAMGIDGEGGPAAG